MLWEHIWNGLLEPCHGPYRNPWFLVKKKSGKYRMVNVAMEINWVTIQDANLLPVVDKFSEEFAEQQLSSLVNFYSGYDQIWLVKPCCDLTAFMTLLGLLQQTTLPQGATNSVAQFVWIVTTLLQDLIPKKCLLFLDDVGIKGLKTTYQNEEVEPGIQKYVLKHIQNINETLFYLKLAGCVISGEKSQFCMPEIKIVGFMCDSEGRHPDTVKVIKILEWTHCKNTEEAWSFLGICVYYQIFIPEFAIISAPIYALFKKDVEFHWEKAQWQAMSTLQTMLTSPPTLVTLSYTEGAGEIILAVDASLSGWGSVLMQVDINTKNQHLMWYESGVWSPTECKYDARKRECRGLLKALKKVWFWLYSIHFTIEIDANTLVA